MPSKPGRPSFQYHLFILSLWQESGSLPGQPDVWRCSVEDAQGGQRRGFKNLDELFQFLDNQVRLWGDPSPENLE
jgi:hypothetical protein